MVIFHSYVNVYQRVCLFLQDPFIFLWLGLRKPIDQDDSSRPRERERDITMGMMISKGNHPQMLQHFRLVSYYIFFQISIDISIYSCLTYPIYIYIHTYYIILYICILYNRYLPYYHVYKYLNISIIHIIQISIEIYTPLSSHV